MEAETIMTMVSTVGFPIVMCILTVMYVVKLNEGYREDVKEMNLTHQQEVAGLTQAVNNNTQVMAQLIDKLGL